MLNPENAAHERIAERLGKDYVVWLATASPSGRPHLVPVWFLWDGHEFLIYSQPENRKIRDLRANPRVVVALESENDGNTVAIFEGEARFLDDGARPSDDPAYTEKYGHLLKEMGWTDEQLNTYSLPVAVTPTKLISW